MLIVLFQSGKTTEASCNNWAGCTWGTTSGSGSSGSTGGLGYLVHFEAHFFHGVLSSVDYPCHCVFVLASLCFWDGISGFAAIYTYIRYIFCTYIPNDSHIRVLRTSFHFRSVPGNTEMAFQVLSWQLPTRVPSVMYLSVELTYWFDTNHLHCRHVVNRILPSSMLWSWQVTTGRCSAFVPARTVAIVLLC